MVYTIINILLSYFIYSYNFYIIKTIHAEVYIKPVNIPDSSVTVELFIYDLGCHEIFQDYIPKYVIIITALIYKSY